MKVSETELPDVRLIEPKVFGDTRGFFLETWSQPRYAEIGVPGPFLQDNLSRSGARILRGMHLQHPFGQGKLVYVLEGSVFDVAVDVRVGSPTFGKWTGRTLSADNKHQLYVPAGFAHGFCVIGETATFAYKCTEAYHPEAEVVLAWDDPDVGIEWPINDPRLSEKDLGGLRLADIPEDRLPTYGSV